MIEHLLLTLTMPLSQQSRHEEYGGFLQKNRGGKPGSGSEQAYIKEIQLEGAILIGPNRNGRLIDAGGYGR